MPQYRTGAASFTNSSLIVQGTQTAWLSNASTGDLIAALNENVWYEIASVQSDTQLTLKTIYANTTKTAAPYLIQRDFTAQQKYPLVAYGDQDTASLISLAFQSIDQKLNILQTALAGLDTLTLTGDLDLDLTALNNLNLTVKAPLGNLRNRFVNGGMRIWQRGTTRSLTSAGGYGPDRWKLTAGAGQALTAARVTDSNVPTGFRGRYALKMSAAISNDKLKAGTNIEGADLRDLDGKDCTLSFDVFPNNCTAPYYQIWMGAWSALDNNNPNWQLISTASIPNNTTSKITVPLTASQMVGVKNGATFSIEVGHNGGANIDIYLGSLQLELGTVTNDFEYRPLTQEMLFCSRFYQTSYDFDVAPGTALNNWISPCTAQPDAANSFKIIPVSFRHRMRVTPTVAIFSPYTGAANMIRNGTTNADLAALLQAQTTQGFQAYVNNVSVAAGANLGVHYTADAEF